MISGLPLPVRITAIAVLAGSLAGTARAASSGAELYARHCIACHQAEGEGTPGIAPPIAGVLAKRAATPEGREFFPRLLLNGMTGSIVSQGIRYNGNMPPVANLADAELAAIVNHVLSAFNGSTVQLSPDDFAAARSTPVPPTEVRKQRERLLAIAGE